MSIDARALPIADRHPLAAEHRLLSEWLHESMALRPGQRYYQSVELKETPTGQTILASSPEVCRLIILAAIEQAEHWNAETLRIRDQAAPKQGNWNLGSEPAWVGAQGSRLRIQEVMGALLRRNLPMKRDDVLKLLALLVRTGYSYSLPIGYSSKTVERYLAQHELDEELATAIRKFAVMLRQSGDNDAKRTATRLEQLSSPSQEEPASGAPLPLKPAPTPVTAGDPHVLSPLKHLLGMLSADITIDTVTTGPDRYAMSRESPLADEHAKLASLLEEKIQAAKWNTDLETFKVGKEILGRDDVARGRLLVAAVERHMASLLGPAIDYSEPTYWKAHSGLDGIVRGLGRDPVVLDRSMLFDVILYLAMRPSYASPRGGKLSESSDTSLFSLVGKLTSDGEDLREGERYVLSLWRSARVLGPYMGAMPEDVKRLTRWIADGASYFLVPGESWSDRLNADLAALPANQRENWIAVVHHALTATSARPSAKWQKSGLALVSVLGEPEFREKLERWLPQVTKGRSVKLVRDPRGVGDSIHDENATALRGFLWLLPMLARRDGDARLVASVALSAFRKIPGVGPRAVKVGNAAIYALSEMLGPEAMSQLAMLKVRVRFGTAQKEIEKAFDAAARALNLPRNEVEEISVPDCGLQSVGLREETFGDYRVRVEVNSSDVVTTWFDGKGKMLKAVPAAVKRDHAEDWKELQGDLKDLAMTISAQKERIDNLLIEQRTWPVQVWRERYLDHPLVGTIARRLIWKVNGNAATFVNGEAQDVAGNKVSIDANSMISLWHPVGHTADQVVAWRRQIEALAIVQPFKQAHREVYLVTDAEVRTERYSNRFAAHILRQHQFNALCGARHWKNKLRLMVDDEYPPAARELLSWGFRAEFWIEGIGDSFGQDTNEAGSYLRLASDQVRFYRVGATQNSAHAGGGGYRTRAFGAGEGGINEALRMADVPALVFSEIMRDVDLFVGVASIGNDPAWQDGGGENRYGTYWQNYSFGDLSTTAVARREILERLIPRLKIASKCVISDRFLLVQGTHRRYKIHLGSGNILMEPNDQYLCIVPDAKARAGTPQVYLPFEGDSTLSIILSKAFLLAEDGTIKDPVILRQLHS